METFEDVNACSHEKAENVDDDDKIDDSCAHEDLQEERNSQCFCISKHVLELIPSIPDICRDRSLFGKLQPIFDILGKPAQCIQGEKTKFLIMNELTNKVIVPFFVLQTHQITISRLPVMMASKLAHLIRHCPHRMAIHLLMNLWKRLSRENLYLKNYSLVILWMECFAVYFKRVSQNGQRHILYHSKLSMPNITPCGFLPSKQNNPPSPIYLLSTVIDFPSLFDIIPVQHDFQCNRKFERCSHVAAKLLKFAFRHSTLLSEGKLQLPFNIFQILKQTHWKRILDASIWPFVQCSVNFGDVACKWVSCWQAAVDAIRKNLYEFSEGNHKIQFADQASMNGALQLIFTFIHQAMTCFRFPLKTHQQLWECLPIEDKSEQSEKLSRKLTLLIISVTICQRQLRKLNTLQGFVKEKWSALSQKEVDEMSIGSANNSPILPSHPVAADQVCLCEEGKQPQNKQPKLQRTNTRETMVCAADAIPIEICTSLIGLSQCLFLLCQHGQRQHQPENLRLSYLERDDKWLQTDSLLSQSSTICPQEKHHQTETREIRINIPSVQSIHSKFCIQMQKKPSTFSLINSVSQVNRKKPRCITTYRILQLFHGDDADMIRFCECCCDLFSNHPDWVHTHPIVRQTLNPLSVFLTILQIVGVWKDEGGLDSGSNDDPATYSPDVALLMEWLVSGETQFREFFVKFMVWLCHLLHRRKSGKDLDMESVYLLKQVPITSEALNQLEIILEAMTENLLAHSEDNIPFCKLPMLRRLRMTIQEIDYFVKEEISTLDSM